MTPNPLASGAPLGLGFLHSEGARVCRTALEKAAGRYVVFLAHSWEMVRWTSADSVRPWVRDASRGKTDLLEELLALLDGWEFLNLDRVGAREGRGGGG